MDLEPRKDSIDVHFIENSPIGFYIYRGTGKKIYFYIIGRFKNHIFYKVGIKIGIYNK